MSSRRIEILTDLVEAENDLGNPSFIWKNNSYLFIPSISEFNRNLETGGFQIVKLLTATVRKFTVDESGNFIPIFAGGVFPTSQEKFIYSLDGSNYRIESIKHEVTNAFFRITAVSTSRGI